MVRFGATNGTEQTDLNPSATNFPKDWRRIARDIGGVRYYWLPGCEHLGRRHARRIEGALQRIDEREPCGMQRVKIELAAIGIRYRQH